MCKASKPPSAPAPRPAPTKSSKQIQKEAEEERLRYGYGGPGSIAATILTTPLGVEDEEDQRKKYSGVAI